MIRVLAILMTVFALALPALAQEQAAAPSGPTVKSQEEANAITMCQQAPEADLRIESCNKLLTDFQDTEFKELAYYLLMLSHQQKNDFENMQLYGERTLEQNPENVGTLISLSYAIPIRTREHDLDKQEKLAKAEDYAKRGLALIPAMGKLNPQITDEDWLIMKKDFMAQLHESMGIIASKRQDYPKAEESYRKMLQVADKQTGTMFFRLAEALKQQENYEEAMNMLDQSIARGGHKMAGGRDAASIMKAELRRKLAPPAAAAQPAAAPAVATPAPAAPAPATPQP
jgi:tetratricopeptide (TPR) repeat protein